MSSANAQGHPGIVRSCVIVDCNEEELIVITFRLNVLENCCLTAKSKVRVLHFLLGDQPQHSLGGWVLESVHSSGNQGALWANLWISQWIPVTTTVLNLFRKTQENQVNPSLYIYPLPPPHLEWLFVHSGRSNRAGKPPCWHHIYGLHCSDGFTRSKFPSEAKLYEHRIMTSAPAKSSRCGI